MFIVFKKLSFMIVISDQRSLFEVLFYIVFLSKA